MRKISLLVASTFMLLALPAADAQPHNPSRRIIDEIRSQCEFVMPRNCVQVAREEAGIPEQRMNVAVPGQSFVVSGVQKCISLRGEIAFVQAAPGTLSYFGDGRKAHHPLNSLL